MTTRKVIEFAVEAGKNLGWMIAGALLTGARANRTRLWNATLCGGPFRFASVRISAAYLPYAFHIAQNQPFVDGNKRTGLLAAIVFLDLNGIAIVDPEGRLYEAMIAIAERRLDKPGLAALLRDLVDAH